MVIIIKVLFKTNTTHSSQVARWLLVATRVDLTTLYQQVATTGTERQILFSRVLTLEL